MKTLTIILPILFVLGDAFPKPLSKWGIFIVGGRPADQGELPYQLDIRYAGQHHCGASLVEVDGELVGLTAAHCFPTGVPLPPESDLFDLVAGDLSLRDSSGNEQIRKIAKIVKHENFHSLTYENDIALIFMDEPLELNENVSPITLPEAGIDTSGDLIVSGWGRLSYEGSYPDILQVVEVPVVDDETCRGAYEGLGDEIFETFLCAGYLGDGKKDACQGDSGGPAVSVDDGYLAGIVSWGEQCALPTYPGVYTEVSHFIHWINEHVVQNKE